MSVGLRRSLADLACRVLQATLPPSLQSWGWAVRYEATSIEDDTKALLFTLDSVCGLLPRAVAAHLLRAFASLTSMGAPLGKGASATNLLDANMRRPRAIGILCVTGAVVLGVAYMAVAGAPMRYLAINTGALAIGLSMLASLDYAATPKGRRFDVPLVAMASALLATALFGTEVDGAARWMNLGGLAIQPSLVLLPAILVGFARTRSALATAGILIAAVAMALQPDRAMAGMLALSLAVLAGMRRDGHGVVAVAASVTGFATTLARADTLPAVPYVDQILFSSFDVHAGAGLLVWGGSALLLVPAIVGFRVDPDNRAAYAAFGFAWFAAIVAAALGKYPTPIVGYGGSAILGYVLSLFALPTMAGERAGTAPRAAGPADEASSDRHLRVALA